MITFIDTESCERKKLGKGLGEAAEILNNEICGAEEINASLRWLGEGDQFEVIPLPTSHQVIYMMEGNGVVSLEGKEFDVGPGAGLYLGPGESAALHGSAKTLKAFHLIGETH